MEHDACAYVEKNIVLKKTTHNSNGNRLETDMNWENVSFPGYNRWISYSDFKVIQTAKPR